MINWLQILTSWFSRVKEGNHYHELASSSPLPTMISLPAKSLISESHGQYVWDYERAKLACGILAKAIGEVQSSNQEPILLLLNLFFHGKIRILDIVVHIVD